MSDEPPQGRARGAIVLTLSGLRRSFVTGTVRLDVLTGVDLVLHAGEITALVGPSGSGKSTLLHIAGLLETPDAGKVTIAGQDCSALNDRARTAIRRKDLGFVYQFHHLLPEFTALENVMLPQLIAGKTQAEAARWAETLLQRLGLGERFHHRPTRLSGGEQQRVAIARALANRPRILIADEPTGNLDPHTATAVLSALLKLARDDQVAALIATHNLELAAAMDRIVTLVNGRLVENPKVARRTIAPGPAAV